jgi:hypothetical protein
MKILMLKKNIATTLVLTALAVGLLPTAAQAQVGKILDKTLDRTTQRVENRVTNKVNTKTDRAVDKTVDKVFDPNKNKTTTTTPAKTTTTPSTTTTPTKTTTTDSDKTANAGMSSALGSATASTYVGHFQWEVKRYKADKLVADGHKILDFYVKPYDVAVHILAPTTKARELGYVLHRSAAEIVGINEKEGTATKTAAKALSSPRLAFSQTMESKQINGVSCVKYKAENAEISLTVWVDEGERMPMLSSFSIGMGVERAEFEILPLLSDMKIPVYEGLLEYKKKGEKLQFWLNKFDTNKPDEKAFDYSRYLQK